MSRTAIINKKRHSMLLSQFGLHVVSWIAVGMTILAVGCGRQSAQQPTVSAQPQTDQPADPVPRRDNSPIELNPPQRAGDPSAEGAGIGPRGPGWRYRHPDRNFPFYSSAAIAQDLIIVGGRDKMLHAIDRQSGESRWVFAAGARIDSSPVIAGQRVFFATASGRIHAIDLDSGEVGWSFDTGSSIAASPAVANRRLVIGDLDGTLYCFAGGTE